MCRGSSANRFSAIRQLEAAHFDQLVAVVFNNDFTVARASLVPREAVMRLAFWQEHVNGWILPVHEAVWSDTQVRDITEVVAAAQNLEPVAPPAAAREALAPRRTRSDGPKILAAGILPIILDPADPQEFKLRLLERKAATMTIFYEDGRRELRDWDASRFSARSDVINNLRSRPYLRQGEWQTRGIAKVHVRVRDEV